jgi:hypothetical protein
MLLQPKSVSIDVASSIQMHYEPFWSGLKVKECRETRSRLAKGTPSELTDQVRDSHVSTFNWGVSKLAPVMPR